MFLNINSGPGTAPDPHFQALVRQAQAAGIAVLGYSSTSYGQRPIGSVETEVRQYRAWYRVNGMFLDVIQGTPGELPYYRALASYVRATVPDAVIWLNPGTYPDPGYMSVGNVVMVFEAPTRSTSPTRCPPGSAGTSRASSRTSSTRRRSRTWPAPSACPGPGGPASCT